jgi:transposase InsO family protein
VKRYCILTQSNGPKIDLAAIEATYAAITPVSPAISLSDQRTAGLPRNGVRAHFSAIQVEARSAAGIADAAEGLAAVCVRYGYRRLHVLLRREGWPVNHKRIYRLYSEEGLSIRTKLPRRKRAWRYRTGRRAIDAPNEVWAMDFMSDALLDGRPFRLLTVMDCCSREGLATVPRANFRAFHVVRGARASRPQTGQAEEHSGRQRSRVRRTLA